MIAIFLSTTYQSGYKLSGIVYLRRISDFRVGGISRRNFSMFRKLCGDETLRNVALVTNMWGEVEPELGAAREAELRTDDLLFAPVLRAGAVMLRHDGTRAGAQAVLARLVDNSPRALRIQRELVDERKNFAETGASRATDRVLAELLGRHAVALSEIREETTQTLTEKHELAEHKERLRNIKGMPESSQKPGMR
ncbi:hypothetical protein PsYK624_060970 [Phanerochaete sordida]|uniref:Uncharacterized protein n=1 Tax=Phanerochaete sordida TaxID=48140 RepID=A0A9P3G7Z4_9APHY|nr:hypothetical protein PsYK624_060970 [Phanerochaete sordida]